MKFSVIILSFNSERTLDRCLTDVRLALAKYNEPSEVFVVENGSKDKSPEILSRHQGLGYDEDHRLRPGRGRDKLLHQ